MDINDINAFFDELASKGLKPILTNYAATGYHGTLVKAAEKIVDTQKLIMSTRGLLGPGGYFYEHNSPLCGVEAGKNWVMHRPRDEIDKVDPKNIRVIMADLKMERLFDMTDGRNADYLEAVYDFFVKFTATVWPEKLHKINEAAIGNFIGQYASEHNHIQGIRGRLKIPKQGVTQISLVVRDQSCMFNLRHSEETEIA